jgi:hypothetical protein
MILCIIFSEPEVRALLAGRKTQARRPAWKANGSATRWQRVREGDVLVVRETWGAVSPDEDPVPTKEAIIEYKADLPPGCTDGPGGWPEEHRGHPDALHWQSPAIMPRWAARFLLTVEAVRIERLWDIHEDDAQAEGVKPVPFQPEPPGAHRVAFREFWCQQYGPEAWDANPEVVVLKFRVTRRDVNAPDYVRE